MKSRIARLEGEARTAKRLHDSLGKHVKILEIALTKERERVKSLSKGEKVDLQRDPRDVAREELKAMGKGLSHLSNHVFMTDYCQNHLSKEYAYWILTLSKRIPYIKD
jgi:Striatin family